MSKETEQVYVTPTNLGDLGSIHIAEDVVASIVSLAATEVEGVAYMFGNVTKEIIGKLGIKNLTKGVVIGIEGNYVSAELSVVMRYGYGIPKTAKAVQEKVRSAVESMTGLTVERVNVHIVGVDIDKA